MLDVLLIEARPYRVRAPAITAQIRLTWPPPKCLCKASFLSETRPREPRRRVYEVHVLWLFCREVYDIQLGFAYKRMVLCHPARAFFARAGCENMKFVDRIGLRGSSEHLQRQQKFKKLAGFVWTHNPRNSDYCNCGGYESDDPRRPIMSTNFMFAHPGRAKNARAG